MGFHLGTVFLRLVLLTSTADGELRKLANRSTSFPFSLFREMNVFAINS